MLNKVAAEINAKNASKRAKAIKDGKTIKEGKYKDVEFDLDYILKLIKKKFACNGHINRDLSEEKLMGDVIQLQGDQRKNVKDWLLDHEEGMGEHMPDPKKEPEFIQIHGF